MHTGYTQANGLKIYYGSYGSGIPLILLHAATQTADDWRPFIPRLSERFRVFALDTRGHGRTDNPAGYLSYGMMADDVAAFTKTLGLDRPFVVGYSDGGQTAIEIGMRYPGLTRGLIAGGVGYKFDRPAYLQFMCQLLETDKPENFDAEHYAQKQPRTVANWRRLHSAVYGPDSWKTLLKQLSVLWTTPLNYTSGDFQKITEPLLILNGDRDEAFSLEEAVEMYHMVPNAELAIAPGATHLFYMTRPDLFSTPVIDFLLRKSS